MNYLISMVDKRAIIDQVLPSYKKIAEAPSRYEELPGYSNDFTAEELDRFKAKVTVEERSRKYKTVDANGNIYLVVNPWPRDIETRKDGTIWVVYPKPKLVMTYAEAKRNAKETAAHSSSPNSASLLGGSSEKKKPQTEFDY